MRSYAEHYAEARANYLRDKLLAADDPNHRRIQDLGVLVLPGNDLTRWGLIQPFNFWKDAVGYLAEHARACFADDKRCFFPKNWKRSEDLSQRVAIEHVIGAPGAEAICEAILPQVERLFFQCYLQADHAYLYRNLVTKAEQRSSWLWHYDNHPVEMHKLMVYLTDVTEETAPFEYLAGPDGKPAVVAPSRTGPANWKNPKWKGSRVPEAVMKAYFAKGYTARKVTGCRGTAVLFDDNCVHRANVGRAGHRDVFVVQFRPTLKPLLPRLDLRWTGSFEANDISMDPDNVKPYRKAN